MYGPALVRPRAVENERDQERAKLGRLPGSAYNDEAAACETLR